VKDLDVNAEKAKPVFKIEQRGNKFNLALSFNESFFALAREKTPIENAITHFNLPFKITYPTKFKAEGIEILFTVAKQLN